MAGDPNVQVIVAGQDFSKYVTSVTNDFKLGSIENSSTVELKADSAAGNIELLRVFLPLCNRQAEAKVFVRGFYDDELQLRMAGRITTINGSNPFTGLSVSIKNPSVLAPSNSASPQNASTEPYLDTSVSEIVRDIIRKAGWKAGQVDNFRTKMGAWYPAGRTFGEQLQTLANKVGARIQMRPLTARVVGKPGERSVKIDGLFARSATSANGDKPRTGTFSFIQPGGAGEETKAYTTTNEAGLPGYDFEALTPNPRFISGAPLVRPDTPGYQRTQTEIDQLERQRREIHPVARSLVSGATLKSFENKEAANDLVQLVTVIDNSGAKVYVEPDVVEASLAANMVVDFLREGEGDGMLGESGLVLTLRDGPLSYPELRVREFGDFSYDPPVGAWATAATMDSSSTKGALDPTYRKDDVPINETDTIEDIAKRYPTLFRQVTVTTDLDGKPLEFPETLYIAYDKNLFRRTASGRYFATPNEAGKDEADAESGKAGKPISLKEFQALPTSTVYELYLKRRASLYGTSGSDEFASTVAPYLVKRLEKAEPGSEEHKLLAQEIKRLEDAELDNPYTRRADRPDEDQFNPSTSSVAAVPPVFRASENARKALLKGDSKNKIQVAGKPIEKRKDGQYAGFRAQTLVLDISTGSDTTDAELVKDGQFPFNATVTVDAATGVVPGFYLSLDETLGPLGGAYVIDAVTESLAAGSYRTVLHIMSQRLMDGNAAPAGAAGILKKERENLSDFDPKSGVALDENGRPIAVDPALAEHFRQAGTSRSGLTIAQTAQLALSADWATNEYGRCSKWVRQTVEHAAGVRDFALKGILFGDTAKESAKLMRARGLVKSYAQMGGKTGLRPGDIVLQETGSPDADGNDQGHMGVVGLDGLIHENSTKFRGSERRGTTRVEDWGPITGVVRAADLEAAGKAGQRGIPTF